MTCPVSARWSVLAVLLAAVTLAAAALALAPPVSAKTFVVTKRGDPAPGSCTKRDCSLREAVLAANQNLGSADTVALPNRRKPYLLKQAGSNDDGPSPATSTSRTTRS